MGKNPRIQPDKAKCPVCGSYSCTTPTQCMLSAQLFHADHCKSLEDHDPMCVYSEILRMHIFEPLRKMLDESAKPKHADGVKCAICGLLGSKYAMHLIEFSQWSKTGETHGCFPICVECAPVCIKCGLPRITRRVRLFYSTDKCLWRKICTLL